MNYKECKTAAELNAYTEQERNTRCGYANYHWSQSGVCQSTLHGFRDNFTHTRQRTFRDNLEEVFTKEESEILLRGE